MSNHGLFEITKLEEARQAWEIFFNRFYSPELSKQVNVEFDPKQREFIPRKLNKLKNKNFAWDEGTSSDDDQPTFHSDDFDDFLNGNTVKIPRELNEADLKQVEEAILQGDYKNERFKNKNTIFMHCGYLS